MENQAANHFFQDKLDEFLDVYSLYLKAPISLVHEEVCFKAFELHLLDPQFRFPS